MLVYCSVIWRNMNLTLQSLWQRSVISSRWWHFVLRVREAERSHTRGCVLQ